MWLWEGSVIFDPSPEFLGGIPTNSSVDAMREHTRRAQPRVPVRMALIPLLCLVLIGAGCGGDDDTAASHPGSGGVNGGGGSKATGGVSGGGGSKATGGATGGVWATRCQSVADHNASCGKGSNDQAAVDECIATRGCAPSAWSAEVVDSIMDCLTTLACDQPDDDCISATADLQTPTKLALFDACQSKTASCPGFDGCLETMFLVSDELALELQACLEQDCDAAATCMTDEYFGAVMAADCSGELPFGG